MATYSFNIKSQPKTKYGSKLNAAAHFDYIDRDGAYKNREDLLAYGSGNMPDWAPTPHHYWEAASLYERANGNAYREITWALPSELPLWANESLVQEFCQETFGEKFTYSYAIHSKDSSDPEHDNVHVHIMFNERELTKDRTYDDPKWHFTRYTETDGFPVGYCKSREFMQKATVHKLRERAADLTNKYYKDFDMQERVDHRSFKNQKKALIEEGRFSEAAKFDNVEPQRRIPAAQYYKEKNLQQHIEPDQINKIHNEMSKEIRKQQEELYQEFYNQNVVYAVNLKDYFGDLKYQNIEAAKQELSEISKISKESMNNTREIINKLKQRSIEEELHIIQDIMTMSNIQINVKNNIFSKPTTVQEWTLTMISKELANNVIKHSNATECDIIINEDKEQYSLLFSDNGCGFEKINGEELKSIKERLKAVNGKVNIISSKKPTTIKITIIKN